MSGERLSTLLLLRDKISKATQIICVFAIVLMFLVTFGPVVNKYFSEVGFPNDGFTYNDWYIEPGDRVVRENEVLKIYGDIIIQPGGNLSLLNCEILFFHPSEGNFILHVQKNESSGVCGELFMSGTKVSVINESAGYYYDFKIEGNASIDGCDISFVGSETTYGGILVYSDNVTITNSEIHANEKYGIYTNSNPIIINNNIYDNYYGIYFDNSTGEGSIFKDNEGDNQFGSYINCMYDFNNDTYSDVVVTAPNDDTIDTDAGAVYIFYGTPNMCLSDLTPFDADVKLFGRNSSDKFGSKVDFSGDLNGDGFNDLVITAPGSDKVYVYFANASGYGGVILNQTSTQFSSGILNGMEVLTDGVIGDGRLALIGEEIDLSWYLDDSGDRAFTQDINFWSDGVSISFPDSFMEYTVDTISDHVTGYFSFDYGKDESLDYTETGINYTNTYYDGTTSTIKSVFGLSGNALDFDGENDYLKIEPDADPLSYGNGTVEFWFNSQDDTSNNRSYLNSSYRKMLFGEYYMNLSTPEWGIVIEENKLHVETYEVNGSYTEEVEPPTYNLNYTYYYNEIDQSEDLISYDGPLVQFGGEDLVPMTGVQSSIYLTPQNSIQADGNSWKELEIGQYFLLPGGHMDLEVRCDDLPEIMAIGIANGTGPDRNELLYYIGGRVTYGNQETGTGTWVNNSCITDNMQWEPVFMDLYNNWTELVNSTDLGFDRIIIISDDDQNGTGISFVDDIHINGIFELEFIDTLRDVFNGSIETTRILSSDCYISPYHDYHLRFYQKDGYAFLEIDGELQDIQEMSISTMDRIQLDEGAFYIIGQRPLNDTYFWLPSNYTYDTGDSFKTFANYNGWVDELRFYDIPIELTSYEPRDEGVYPYSADIYTELLLHLDEGSGDIQNEYYYSIYDYTPDDVGVTWSNDGYFDKSGVMDGDDYINCGDRYNLSEGTFEAYISLDTAFSSSSSTDMFLLYHGDNDPNTIKLYFESSNGQLYFVIEGEEPGSPYTVVSNRDTWYADRWYHIAVTWSDEMRMYIDGVLQFDVEECDEYCTNEGEYDLIIGADYSDNYYNRYYDGKIDEVRLSNIVRTDFPEMVHFRKEEECSEDGSVFLVHFNEGYGSTAADSISSQTGTLGYEDDWSNGYFGRGVEFGGNSSSKVTFTNYPDTDVSSELSIEAWIYPTSVGQSGDNIIIYRQNSYQLSLYKDGSNNVYLRGMVNQNGNEYTTTSTDCYNFKNGYDRWYHVGMTYDTTTKALRTFINGRLDAEDYLSTSNTIPETSTSIIVGEYFKGKIDEVRISDTRLDYFNISTSYDHDMITQIRFDEGTGLHSANEYDSDHQAVLYNGEEYGGEWVDGHIGKAIRLDGDDDYVLINDTEFDYGSKEIAVSLYVKLPQTLSGERYVILEKEDSYNISIVKDTSSYHLECSVVSNNVSYTTSTPAEAVDLNQLVGYWFQVGMTLSEGKLYSYVNGRKNGEISVSSISISDNDRLYLGCNSDGNFFDGMLDDLTIWNVNRLNHIRYRSEVWTSIKSFLTSVKITSIDIPVTIPNETSVKYQVRYGNTTEEIENASWFGPDGASSYYIVNELDYSDIGEVGRYVQVKILIESDKHDVSPNLYQVKVDGLAYPDAGSYESAPCELPDWVDRVVPQIDFDVNGRDVSFKLSYSLNGTTWYNHTMSDGVAIDFSVYSTKFLKYYITVAASSYQNGVNTPRFDSVRLWYEFDSAIGSLELSDGNTSFGNSISSSGDFNGDNFSDIAIGCPDEKFVKIYYGGGAMDDEYDSIITSTITGFGDNLTSIDDFNGDGCSELGVVATGDYNVYMYSGSDLSGNVSSTGYEDRISGTDPFGVNIFSLGDLNGDKFDDVGVYSADNMFYVYSGHDLYENSDLTSSQYLVSFDGGTGSTLGFCAVGDFDLDGDSIGDILLTDPALGKSYVFNGSEYLTGDYNVADAVYTFYRSGTGEGYGRSASVGDINGDNFIEFLISETDLNTGEGIGAVHSPGPSTGRIGYNTYWANDYGVYFASSQQCLEGDVFYYNDYSIYSDDSTLALTGLTVHNSTSEFGHDSYVGLSAHDSYVMLSSSTFYTLEDSAIETFDGNLMMTNVTVDQSITEYTVDYSLDVLDTDSEHLTIDGSQVKLMESGSSMIFSENWSEIDTSKWNSIGSGEASFSNNSWSGSGSDLKFSCDGTTGVDGNYIFSYRVDFDDTVEALDYKLVTRFILTGNVDNYTANSASKLTLEIQKDIYSPTQTRKMVFSSYNGSTLGGDPINNGWRDCGDCWEKNDNTSDTRTWYRVAKENYMEVSLDDPILKTFGLAFKEDNTNWKEIDYIKVTMRVVEDSNPNASGLDYDPTIYMDKFEVTNPSYTPVYYQSGFLVSDSITKPVNNDWNELFVRYQDPNDIDKLELYLLNGDGSDTQLTQIVTLPFDLSSYNSYDQLKFKAEFSGNAFSTSSLTSWGINFLNTNDEAVYGDGGHVTIRDCDISNNNGIDISLTDGCVGRLIDTLTEDDKISLSGSGTRLDRYCRIDVETYPEIQPYMDEGFHHDTSPFCDFTLYDKNDDEVFNGYTNGTGKLVDILLLESIWTQEGIDFLGPFRLNMTGGNNVQFNPGLTKVLWINNNSLDSDDDFILDVQENNDKVHWYEGEDLCLDKDRIEKTWEASGELGLLPDDDGVFIDRYFGLPDGSDNDLKVMFRAGPTDGIANKQVRLSIWSVDGYTTTSLVLNKTYKLSTRFRYYVTPIYSFSGDSDHLKIRLDTVDSDVVFDSLVIIRSSDELGGLITNPLVMDSDKDLIIDGVEQRSGTLWYEAEHYGSGDIGSEINASSGLVIAEDENDLVSKVPVHMDAGTIYRYYNRARSTQDSTWETISDFSYNLSGWTAIENNGTRSIQNEEMYLFINPSGTAVERNVMYTDDAYRTNATFKIDYTVLNPIQSVSDARILIGVVDGDNPDLRTEFAIGDSDKKHSIKSFSAMDFSNNTFMIISDGKDLGLYQKNLYGGYSQLRSADVRAFGSFKLFIGISSADKNVTYHGRMGLFVDGVQMKAENFKLDILDSTNASVSHRNYTLDNNYRWNYLTYNCTSTGTYYLTSSNNGAPGILGDKVMLCNMSQVKQYNFLNGSVEKKTLSIGENDYDSSSGHYTYTVDTAPLPGTSFTISAFTRARTDMDIDPVDGIGESSSYRDPPSISDQKIVWTEKEGNDYNLKVYDIQSGGTPSNFSLADNDYRNASIWGNYVAYERHSDTGIQIWVLELDTSTSRKLTRVSNYPKYQLHPQIHEDRIVFEGWNDGEDKDIFVYDLDLDDNGLFNYYEAGYDSDDDMDSHVDEDPIDCIDNDNDDQIDEDRNYNGTFHLNLSGYGPFINEDRDQTYPQIDGDRIVFFDENNGESEVWLVSLLKVKDKPGQRSEACLEINSTKLISEEEEHWNLRISGNNIVFGKMEEFAEGTSTVIEKGAIGVYDLSHNKYKVLSYDTTSFDLYNENLIFAKENGDLCSYDLNAQIMSTMISDYDSEYPAIFKNTFCWLNDTGSATTVSCYSQHFTISSAYNGNVFLETAKVIPIDEFTSDFGPDMLNYLYGKTGDHSYSLVINTTLPIDITLDCLDIQLEYIMDPLDPDTDYDGISDGEEVVTYGGVDILECEDAQTYKAWTPQSGVTEYLATSEDELDVTAGYGFFQSRSVALTSSIMDSITESWIKMRYVPEKSGVYRFSLNYPEESRGDMLQGTMIPGNLPKSELLPQGSLSIIDQEINSTEHEYLEDILLESYNMKVSYSYNEISPLQYGSESAYSESVVLTDIMKISTNPQEESERVVIGEVVSEGEYRLVANTEYTIELKLDMASITTFIDDIEIPERISLQKLDYIRIDFQGLDPMSRDSDNDGIADGDEAFNATRYALSADPDRDGISDYWEFEFGTNFGDRDTDGDGLRDGVELGLSSQFIKFMGGYENSTGSYFERIAHSGDSSPFNHTKINNYDADNGSTVTNPLDPDTDDDGLPDGWIDGWYYGDEIFPNLYRTSNNDFWDRYDKLDYWEYQPWKWGRKMDPDNLQQIYEGEDFNLDGRTEPYSTIWSFDPYTFEFIGVGETNSTESDTDSDGIDDGYEVWYSHLWPYFIFRNGTVEGFDPTQDDSYKDIDDIGILWEHGVMDGETNLQNSSYNVSGVLNRKASFDYVFASQIEMEPNFVQGFAQRVDLKAGELYDVDFIEVKAEFYRETLVEIWEGRDDEWGNPHPHMVYPERPVYSRTMPPTRPGNDGWIKIPMDGEFYFNRTIIESTSKPVYFLVIKSAQQPLCEEAGFVWYSKKNCTNPEHSLIYTEYNQDLDYFHQLIGLFEEGFPGQNILNTMFKTMWSSSLSNSTDSAWDIKNSSDLCDIYSGTFGYRLIDLDKEVISLTPMEEDGEIDRCFNLTCNTEKIAMRSFNFTEEEKGGINEISFYVETGNEQWFGELSIWFGKEENIPVGPTYSYSYDATSINASADFSGWVTWIIDFNDGEDQDPMMNYWIVIESTCNVQISFINAYEHISGMGTRHKLPGQNWQEDTDLNPAFMLVNNKFNSYDYGDGLSNLDEYIIGTHPKKNNTDLIIIDGEDEYDDLLKDGAEIYAGGSSASYEKGGVIYRTSFYNGSKGFSGYNSGFIHYDSDGAGSNESALNFTYSRVVMDPPASSPCCWDTLSLILTLKDGSGVFIEEFDIINEGLPQVMYIWSGTSVIPESTETDYGYKFCPGKIAVYTKVQEGPEMSYQPSDRNREIYFSNPFEIDTDQDGIVDGEEIRWTEDSDSDLKNNIRDTDSDNDGLLDRQEIRWNLDEGGLDTDSLKNMVDPDSDEDGILDGDEVSWNFDTDGDGKKNMVDPDSDGDGLVDGWVDDKIWDANANSGNGAFVDYDNTYYTTYNSGTYSFPKETHNYFDPWEGEDLNMNGIHDRDEPDPTKVDTDGDALWDGFDIYADPSDRSGTPLHFGELYYCAKTEWDYDMSYGLPFSASDYRRIAQNKVPIGSTIQLTSQTSADTDGDGLTDYEEILTWYLKVEDFKPAFNLTDEYPESYYAFNKIGTQKLASDPNDYDSDDDGLSDKDEYLFTNPLDIDSDNDGLPDKAENWHNFNTRDYDETNPCDRDTDDDGLPDGWADGWDLAWDSPPTAVDEITSGECEYNNADAEYSWDFDAVWQYRCEIGECRIVDGEYEWVSNPLKRDTDNDGILDGMEFCFLWNVVDDPFYDSDDDGTTDLYEMDSDDDGLLDSEENRDRDLEMDWWWAVYKPESEGDWDAIEDPPVTGAVWVSGDHDDGYKIKHYNESDPTNEDCDGDGLLDSVEPDPLADTDGDGYINVWDQDSNDASGNGPGVGPSSWGGDISTDLDDNETTENDLDYDNCEIWTNRDYEEVYIVFRTSAVDVDGDRKIDYSSVENIDNWISVDTKVNLWKNENPGHSMDSSYALAHSWLSTGYVISSVRSTEPIDKSAVIIYYDDTVSGEPENLYTPEGYQIFESTTSSDIYIRVSNSEWVVCEIGAGTAPNDYVTIVHSDDDFAREGQETIDGRPALDMDPDRDGIITPIENYYGLNPNDADTDNDGVLDGYEPEWWKNSDGDNQFYPGYSGSYESINALDPDSDNDGLLDGTELGITKVHAHSRTNVNASTTRPHSYDVYIKSDCYSFDMDKGATTTDPLNPDSDGDGLFDCWDDDDQDGVKDGGEARGEDGTSSYFDEGNYGDGAIDGDTDKDGYWDSSEKWKETSPNDQDCDDDGISDKDETVGSEYWYEDYDEDGRINAVDPDSDNDYLYDGLERGYKPSNVTGDTDLTRPYFVPDPDHKTTKQYDDDTDDDTIKDGTEDANHNGKIDGDNGDGIYQSTEYWTELNPNSADTDGDTLSDNDERNWSYNPLSKDSDNDGLTDDEEDEDGDGILDAGETDPLNDDSDEDGLDDNMELTGWTVVIIYESTKEQKTHYKVTSDPRDKDSDNDGLSDLDEYKNITDPNKSDTDGDGKSDKDELTGDYNSSATGIDGAPPEIWEFDCEYAMNYASLGPLKLPSGGLKVRVRVGAKDIFGISYINVDITGLDDIKLYTNNAQNVSHTFEWSISSVDQYKRVLFKGFKINVSAEDRNGNIGFKEDDLPSISKMVVDFFLGPLIARVNAIMELVSGFLTWIEDAIKGIISPPIEKVKLVINDFKQFIVDQLKSLLLYYADNQELVDNQFDSIGNFLTNGPIVIALMVIGLAISAALLLCCGIDSLIAIAISLVIVLILAIIAVVSNGEADYSSGSFFTNIIGNMKDGFCDENPIDEEKSKLDLTDGVSTSDLIELWWLQWSFRFALASLILSWFGVKGAVGTMMEKFTWSKLLITLGSAFSLILSVICIALCPLSMMVSLALAKPISNIDDLIESSLGWWVGFIGLMCGLLSIGICVFSYCIGAVPNAMFGIATGMAVASTLLAAGNLWILYSNERSTDIG